MPWKIQIHPEPVIVETEYFGVLSPVDLGRAVQETIEAGRTAGATLFLADCSGLVGGHSMVDLYGLADLLATLGFDVQYKEAVVMPGLDAPAENVRFWETVCLNRGLRVRIFPDRPGALEWLTAQSA